MALAREGDSSIALCSQDLFQQDRFDHAPLSIPMAGPAPRVSCGVDLR
jgi:hypothetical protein